MENKEKKNVQEKDVAEFIRLVKDQMAATDTLQKTLEEELEKKDRMFISNQTLVRHLEELLLQKNLHIKSLSEYHQKKGSPFFWFLIFFLLLFIATIVLIFTIYAKDTNSSLFKVLFDHAANLFQSLGNLNCSSFEGFSKHGGTILSTLGLELFGPFSSWSWLTKLIVVTFSALDVLVFSFLFQCINFSTTLIIIGLWGILAGFCYQHHYYVVTIFCAANSFIGLVALVVPSSWKSSFTFTLSSVST